MIDPSREYVPFWRRGPGIGTGRKAFASGEELYKLACEYFEWIDEHPLREEVAFHYQGGVTVHYISKARPYTLQGLATFLGITMVTILKQRKEPHTKDAMAIIDQIIYTQKFEGAAAGFFNHSIIARDLGLADKTEVSGLNGEPIKTVVQYQLPDNGRSDVDTAVGDDTEG